MSFLMASLFNPLTHFHAVSVADIILLIGIGLIWPIYSYISMKQNPIEKIRSDTSIRVSSYNQTMLHLWGIALSILIIWYCTNRPFDLLGFQHRWNVSTFIVWVVVALGIIFCAAQLFLVVSKESVRIKIEAQLRNVGEYTELLMPKTKREYHHSLLVGLTAGITEEIIFRGYIIWALGLFMPLWLAGIGSVLLFVLLHLYQEKSGLIQVTLFAMVATILFLVSGSIWPCIVLHIGVDLLNISLAWKVGLAREDAQTT